MYIPVDKEIINDGTFEDYINRFENL
jgi:hypothetical protein